MLPRVVIGRAWWRDRGGAGASELTLRKIRAVVWCRRVRTQHRDAAGVAQLAQHFGSGVAGAASANDDDGTGYVGRGDGARRHQPFAHVSHAIALLDAPAGHRVECRSAQYLAAAQPEARMVPRATDRVADQKPVSEWGAVVCAGRADRKQLVATSCHEDRYIVDVPEQHGAVGDFGERNALDEVRPIEGFGGIAHSRPSLEAPGRRIKSQASEKIQRPIGNTISMG